jgi:hypothetical protein
MAPIATVQLSEKPLSPAPAGNRDGGRTNPMPETQEDLSVQLAEERRRREASEALLAEEREKTRRELNRIRLGELKGKVTALTASSKPKITPAIANRLVALGEVLINNGATKIKLSTKIRLAEGSPEVDELDVLDEFVDLLGNLPEGEMKTEEANLSEEEDEGTSDSDKLKASEAAARKKVDENPKLKFAEVYAAELKARGINNSSAGRAK